MNLINLNYGNKWVLLYSGDPEQVIINVYLIFQLKRFSYEVKNQDKSPRKIYAIDVGLYNTLGFRFSENIGRLAENIVYFALKRKQILNPQILKITKALIITEDIEGEEMLNGFNVKTVPLWKWLLLEEGVSL